MKKESVVNARDIKRVIRQPFVQKYKRREFEEDKKVRKLSFDLVKEAGRNPTPGIKNSIEREFS